MNILTIILNRVFYFLTKVKNQSPFFGAILLVSLLLNTLLISAISIIYLLNDKPSYYGGVIYFLIWGFMFIAVFLYAKKRKNRIVDNKITLSNRLNIVVAGIFLLTLILFIFCANINREKLSKVKSEINVKPRKESLEGQIRKLFD